MQILFIANGSIGDAIMSTGLLKHLLDTYPQAEFTIAAGPATTAIFKPFPRLKRLITVTKQKHSKHWFTLWNEVRRERWDLVVDLRSSMLSYLLRAKQRKIFRRPDTSRPKIEQLGALFGLPHLPTQLWVSEESRQKALALLPAGEYIVLTPKSNSAYKDWPIERFVELAPRLLSKPRFASSTIVVLALANQKESVAPLVRALPADRVVDLSGQTDIPTVCAILQGAQLFIGNDSGLLHMAGALKTKLVGLYGPTNDKEYAPRGQHVRVAKVREFAPGEKEHVGSLIIETLTVEKVEAAVEDLFA